MEEAARRRRENPPKWYEPANDKIERFHRSRANVRAIFGGNRSSKTESGTMEMIWHLLGDHPYQPVPKPPVYWRTVVVDYTELEKVVNEKLQRQLPREALINRDWRKSYNDRTHILTLANGSKVDMMTHEQPILAYEGAARDGTFFDEEPPHDVYTSAVMRHIDRAGRTIMAMTPLAGLTWVYDEIYLKSFGANPNIESYVVSIYENKFLDMDSIRQIESLVTDEIDREIRLYGKFRSRTGLVFKDFDPQVHIYREEDMDRLSEWWDSEYPPPFWPHLVGIDPGWDHPTGVVWLAIDPDTDDRWFYRAYKQSGMFPDDHAEKIQAYNKQMGLTDPVYVIDSQAKATDGKAKGTTVWSEYHDAGIIARLGTKKLFDGNMRLAQLMRVKHDLRGEPSSQFHVSYEAMDLVDEIGKYQRAKPTDMNSSERFLDKDNDVIAAARYANWESERIDWDAWAARRYRARQQAGRGFRGTGY